MLRVAAGCLVLAVAVWAGAFHVEVLHDADARLLERLSRLQDTRVERAVEIVHRLIEPAAYALVCLAIIITGWAFAGARRAAAAAAAIAGANVTTQLLKRALAEPRHHDVLEQQIVPVSWPSGHATAATVALLAALLLAPPALRVGVLLLGAPMAAIAAAGVVILEWHYPSDVVGGIAVAGAWTAAAAALVSSRRLAPAATAARRRRWPRATG